MEGILVFLALFAIGERDFFEQKVKMEQEGYTYWTKIECRKPDPNAEALVITTPIGNEYVCYKQTKHPE